MAADFDSDPLLARFAQVQRVLRGAVDDTRELLDLQRLRTSLRGTIVTSMRLAATEHSDTVNVLQSARSVRAYQFYKAVAKVDGRYFSVFDGKTEFRLGERISRTPCHAHRGVLSFTTRGCSR